MWLEILYSFFLLLEYATAAACMKNKMMFIDYVAVNFKVQHVNSGNIQKDAIVDHTFISNL
jgi:hypothetical protein